MARRHAARVPAWTPGSCEERRCGQETAGASPARAVTMRTELQVTAVASYARRGVTCCTRHFDQPSERSSLAMLAFRWEFKDQARRR